VEPYGADGREMMVGRGQNISLCYLFSFLSLLSLPLFSSLSLPPPSSAPLSRASGPQCTDPDMRDVATVARLLGCVGGDADVRAALSSRCVFVYMRTCVGVYIFLYVRTQMYGAARAATPTCAPRCRAGGAVGGW
jgi:hypothetical protein